MKKKIVVTGGNGRFGSVLKKNNRNNLLFPTKKELNILKLNSIKNYLKKKTKSTYSFGCSIKTNECS